VEGSGWRLEWSDGRRNGVIVYGVLSWLFRFGAFELWKDVCRTLVLVKVVVFAFVFVFAVIVVG